MSCVYCLTTSKGGRERCPLFSHTQTGLNNCFPKFYNDNTRCTLIRETRERGGPKLTFKTEANGDSWVHMQGDFSMVGLLVSTFRYKRFLSYLSCSSQPEVQNSFFPHCTLFQFICPHCPASCWQAVVQRRLTLNICL
jgi:hypothetical protein